MADEPTTSGWLPPRAPGGEPAPRFEPAPPEPEHPEPRPWTPPATAGPTFVKPRAGDTNGIAVTALVLGIVGVSLLLLSVGLAFVLTLPCSVAAWICAARARARIAAGQTSAGGGQAQAAYILGVLGVVLGVLAAIGWIVLFAADVDFEGLREDLERDTNPDSVEAVRTAVAALIGR